MEDVEKLVKTTVGEVERLLTTKSVVGEPITIEENTIIPLVSIGFGFGAGAGTGTGEKKEKGSGTGGGTGGGGGIKPVAVVAINKDGVHIAPVSGAADVVEKFGEVIGKVIEERSEKKKEE
jgi:uncharacterized spore protein YtfJ